MAVSPEAGPRAVSDPGVEPVAIIGMSCRLAGGVDSPDAFWDLLVHGRDGIREVPPGRWEIYEQGDPRNAAVLREVTRQGGFLDDAAGFDAAFFGITPREAELMDPQQRVVLEAAWEALEHAGIAPHTLAGSDTGVYMGVGSDDYGRQMLEDLPRIEAWSGIGASACAVANRVSYALDLRGPSLITDTACSSSLVALHLAAQALRSGESGLALAGGVNIMAGPGLTVVLDAAGATSPDGRSKSFDATADGYGRGEGVGVVVLKLLADAQRDGDRILAVLRATAVSQDGRTDGIMAPNADAQEQVARLALRQAGIEADTVDYIEAHGTGTRKGDPIEVGALSRVYGADRGERGSALIGTVKPNIGHLEAGAGIAGLIKAVLAVRTGLVPPTPNVTELNPDIPWAETGLRVATELTPWPQADGPRRAAVSSFGYGGTVAHAVIEQAPAAAPAAAAEPSARPGVLLLSGATEAALRANAGRLAAWLAGPGAGTPAADLAHTLASRRSHLTHRAAVAAADSAGVLDALAKLAEGTPDPGYVLGSAPVAARRPAVWVFSGHGSQWLGMGREMLAGDPAFAAALAEIDEVFVEEIGFSPRAVIEHGPLDEVHVIQPMIFAMQVGLAAALEARGLAPAAVIGHSVGEIAAAVVAGVFDRRDGARLICRRSALLREVAGRGAMAMVDLSFAEAGAYLAEDPAVVAAIAASPLSTVIAGAPADVARVAEAWRAEGRAVREVASDVAFHSPQMDPLLDRLAAAAADLDIKAPRIPVYSTALADPRAQDARDGRYWAANLRNAVRLDQAVAAAVEDGFELFLEVSAHPVVTHSVNETLTELGQDEAYALGTLRRTRPEVQALDLAVGALHTRGAVLDHAKLCAPAALAETPTQAWQHEHYWRTASSYAGSAMRGHRPESCNLLGGRLTVAGDSAKIWQTYLDSATRPYPGSHPIHGIEVVPAAVLLGTFAAAAGHGALREIDLRVPVALSAPREVQVVNKDGALRLASRPAEADAAADGAPAAEWTTHATAQTDASPDESGDVPDPAAAEARCTETLEPGTVVRHLNKVGVADVGFPWRIDALVRGPRELVARLSPLADTDIDPAAAWPSLVDSILSFAPLLFSGEPTLRMPAHLERFALHGELGAEAIVHVALSDAGHDDTVDVTVRAADGAAHGSIRGLRFGRLDGDLGAAVNPRRLVHALRWTPVELGGEGPRLRAVGLLAEGADPAVRAAVEAAFEAERIRVVSIADLESLAAEAEQLGPDDAVLILPPAGRAQQIAADALDASWRLVRSAQLLSESFAAHAPRLWAVTVGSRDSARREDLGQGPLWGLARVVAGEHPELFGGLVDLDPLAPDLGAPHLPELLSRRPDPDVYALRGSEVSSAKLVEAVAVEPELPGREPLACRADSTYLVTGGFGSLGVEIANWLVQRGARRLILAGRSVLPPRSGWSEPDLTPQQAQRVAVVRSLEAQGVTVAVLPVDIADADSAEVLRDVDALGLPPVRGVVHAAGVLDSQMVHATSRESLAAVLAPKVAGTLVLDRLFPVGSLDFLVLFSSIGLQLGLPGQASYASANSFLDAFARHRAGAGDGVSDTVSLAWTSWRAMGMAANAVVDAELADRGVGDVAVGDALRAWELASGYAEPYLAVLRPTALPAGAEPLPILERLARPGAGDGAGDGAAGEFGADLDAETLTKALVIEIAGQVADELRLDRARLEVTRTLTELGLDSVMTVAVRRSLDRRFGLRLPATLLWQYPNVVAIAGHVAEQLLERRADSAAADEPAELVEA